MFLIILIIVISAVILFGIGICIHETIAVYRIQKAWDKDWEELKQRIRKAYEDTVEL